MRGYLGNSRRKHPKLEHSRVGERIAMRKISALSAAISGGFCAHGRSCGMGRTFWKHLSRHRGIYQ